MKKILGYLGYAIASLLVLAIVTHFVLYLFSYRALVVVSGSMEPDIKTGSVIYIKTYKQDKVYDNIKVGDYITFVNNEGHNVTHAVIYLDPLADEIQTQGIRPGAAADEKIAAADFVGKFVFTIAYLGFVVKVIGSRTFVVSFFSVLIIGYLVITLVKEIKKGKTKDEMDKTE